MIPDRRIVKALKRYDPKLSVKWNEKGKYFEVWGKRPDERGGGDVLITPVTLSIYELGKPKQYVPLDERILWWIYEADSYRGNGPKEFLLQMDTRWREWKERLVKNRWDDNLHRAKELWNVMNNRFYSNNEPAKGKYPKFNNYKKVQRSVMPDVRASTSQRVFYRSSQNARRFNYGK